MDQINHEISKMASGILNIIGSKELIDFLNESYELFDTYDTDEEIDIELQEQFDEDITTLRLIKTARAFSRLAERFEKPFRKINKKYPQFDEKCEVIVKELENDVH